MMWIKHSSQREDFKTCIPDAFFFFKRLISDIRMKTHFKYIGNLYLLYSKVIWNKTKIYKCKTSKTKQIKKS